MDMELNTGAVVHTTQEMEKPKQKGEKLINEGSEADAAIPSEPREEASLMPTHLSGANSSDENNRPMSSMKATDTPTGTSVKEKIASEAQQLIEDINAKRRQDTKLIEDFKKSLEDHVLKSCKASEETMFALYQKQSEIMQGKLTELFSTLDKITQLEEEIQEFRASMGMFFQDMAD